MGHVRGKHHAYSGSDGVVGDKWTLGAGSQCHTQFGKGVPLATTGVLVGKGTHSGDDVGYGVLLSVVQVEDEGVYP